jgi:16S rRNA processing protein RimM
MDKTPASGGLLASAVVLSPFALEGFVKVRSLSGETAHLERLSSAVLRGKAGERVWQIEKTLKTAGASAQLLMKFRGIDSPEAAASLSGAEILLGREEAAALAEGEFYIEDLKGLRVIDSAGRELGEVNDILDGGGAQLAELRVAGGALKLVPFRNEFFGRVDTEAGEIVLLETWILE